MAWAEDAMTMEINAARTARGLKPLAVRKELIAAAREHALDMSTHNGMVHIGSDGSDGGARIAKAGYDWTPGQWGEIVGWGFGGNVASMVNWWLSSPGHAPYLLAENVDDIGVGYVAAPGSLWGHYWTVDFGRTAAAPEPPPPFPEGPMPYHSYAPVVGASDAHAPTNVVTAAIDLLRFKVADADCWRVVRHPSGAQEDVQDLELGDGMFVRRKGNNGEWHRYDTGYFSLIHDTSPAVGTGGVERVYTLYKDGVPGAPKSRRFQVLGQEWVEDGLHRVQFRAKRGCGLLAENSGMAQNRSVITRYERGYTFNRYGQVLTFDEVVWEKTGVELQIYGRKDGRGCGWIGWSAPWGESEPVEIHWDRGRLAAEPNRWCGF